MKKSLAILLGITSLVLISSTIYYYNAPLLSPYGDATSCACPLPPKVSPVGSTEEIFIEQSICSGKSQECGTKKCKINKLIRNGASINQVTGLRVIIGNNPTPYDKLNKGQEFDCFFPT